MGSTAQLVTDFYQQAWNERNAQVAADIISPDVQFRGSLGATTRGLNGFLAYVDSVHSALGSYTCTVEKIVANGPEAAAHVRFSGTHIGPLRGLAATGRAVMWRGAAFFSIADRQIVDIWVLGDRDSLKQQLS